MVCLHLDDQRQWVAQCSRILRQQWPHLDVISLEETALQLWRNETLKGMSAEEAAALWLWPLRR